MMRVDRSVRVDAEHLNLKNFSLASPLSELTL
jgi:hypothetical protein